MFRVIRIAAVVATITFMSPLRNGTEVAIPNIRQAGPAAAGVIGQLLTASWKGAGNVSQLLGDTGTGDAALKAALRHTLDPPTTSSLTAVRQDRDAAPSRPDRTRPAPHLNPAFPSR